ncbi:MAG: prenyltransferase, partial [Epsilonproteobacteria bacterium]|nr:prenyltransferase [Campylobacterota bacterium]
MNRFIRLFNTVKYLKFTQVYFRILYFVRSRFRKISGFRYSFSKESDSTLLKLINSCECYSSYKDSEFTMLNLSKKFSDGIEWNYSEYGKLWTYNLTYFEYLKEKEDVSLIYNFIENIASVKDGLEPFPVSLRGINWIKFLTKYQIKDKKIDNSLYAQYYILLDNLEYHLLGNHLLENGFSLLFGAYYFRDEKFYRKAREILEAELDEQILSDGAHFELSPMYHQIMLYRVLDCLNLVQSNPWMGEREDGLMGTLN